MHRIRITIAALLAAAMLPVAAPAGTTGGIAGRVVDAQSQAPLAGVAVTATSPSQVATATTDASGQYRFLSLAPDAYTLSFQKAQYDPQSAAGVSIFADQVQTVNIAMNPTLKTIARVNSRGSANLLKPGTTSDLYSVNSATANAAAGLVGPGGLSNAYGAIASVPGVAVDAGEQGWFQQVHIRGGDIDQVGYELDGIPVNRVYDNAPQTMLSSLGEQELQVYTGGTPASAEAQGIAGYVNQVVKTGTYPGFGTATLSIGAPAFYHRASIEAGGSNPARTFSYYVGIAGANQDYRYLDNNNGAGDLNYFFYPVNAYAGPSGVYIGGNPAPGNAPLFANGNLFGIASTYQRDNIANLHFALPHKHSNLRDDIQLLYLTSEILTSYYSSAGDLGGPLMNGLGFGQSTNYQFVYNDGYVYNGAMFAPLDPTKAGIYYFPSSPPHQLGAIAPASQRDTNDNGVAVTKVQYQHQFSDRAFMRLYGYTLYSNWFIYGPNSANEAYGAELADYEIPDHTYGANLSFTDQLSSQHLLSLAGSFTNATIQRYSNGFIRSNPNVATLYNPATGACYDPTGAAGAAPISCYNAQIGAQTIATVGPTLPTTPLPAGTNFYATSSGIIANLNQVSTRFSSLSLTDEFRPSDRLVLNGGLRMENFKFLLGDTAPNDPARAFWFNVYNREHCLNPSFPNTTPDEAPAFDASGNGICPAGEQTLQSLGNGYILKDASGGSISTTRFEPRLSGTYTLNPDTVLRASYGVYARPQNSSWVQYNTVQEDLPSFLGQHFYAYGFRSPEHDIRPDTSYNMDFSLEKRLHGTDWSFKLTPFYRSTKDQLQNFFIDPLTGLESGLNVGHQISSGVEFALSKGDFNRDGLSGQLALTYTRSRIKYGNFDNTNVNVIDGLNNFIRQYNSYTTACATATPDPNICGSYGNSNAKPTFTNSGGKTITNPYYCTTVSASCAYAAQAPFDKNAYYTTYDVIPGPFSAENGYETPFVGSLVLQWKQKRWAITPTVAFSSGAKYGAPLAWPGYDPSSGACTPLGATTNADAASCGSNSVTGLPLFIPDVYTGKFDNLGDFKQPWRVQVSLSGAYDISSRLTAHMSLVNLVDHCGQRGYAWDQPNVCVYGALPSGIFAPAGNFYPNSNGPAPVQMKYPYTFLLNNNNTGFVGTTLPMQVTFDLQIKL